MTRKGAGGTGTTQVVLVPCSADPCIWKFQKSIGGIGGTSPKISDFDQNLMKKQRGCPFKTLQKSMILTKNSSKISDLIQNLMKKQRGYPLKILQKLVILTKNSSKN